MNDDECLAHGYPIGSGVAEGACRRLVKDRMQLTGMRWGLPGAQAMLHLRAVYLNDDWDRFQAHRIKTECRRLYPYRTAVIRTKRRRAAWREASYTHLASRCGAPLSRARGLLLQQPFCFAPDVADALDPPLDLKEDHR